MKTNVIILDAQIKFLRWQAEKLRDLAARPGNGWAAQNATNMERIADTLLEVRSDLQMTTMSGKRLDARPDQYVVDAIREFQGMKALVCYFATDADRNEFAEMLKQLMPTARAERIP